MKLSQSLIRPIITIFTLSFLVQACSLLDFAPEGGYPEHQTRGQPYPTLLETRAFDFPPPEIIDPEIEPTLSNIQ